MFREREIERERDRYTIFIVVLVDRNSRHGFRGAPHARDRAPRRAYIAIRDAASRLRLPHETLLSRYFNYTESALHTMIQILPYDIRIISVYVYGIDALSIWGFDYNFTNCNFRKKTSFA